MKTLRKSPDGRVLMAQRANGIAISVWEESWNASARMMLSGWTLKAANLDSASADELFLKLAA